MKKTYCNPLDLGYRYQHMKEGPRVAGFREGADPKAGPILKQISDKAAAARGDVAAAVKDNPALVAMMERAMQRMTIESMLMQAGASEEDIKQLNRVLQGISKE